MYGKSQTFETAKLLSQASRRNLNPKPQTLSAYPKESRCVADVAEVVPLQASKQVVWSLAC